MTVSVVVPWRGGCPHREAAWHWVRARYEAVGWDVVVGTCEGEWCKATAVATAIERADAELLVVADADVWCDLTPDAVYALRSRPWAIPHTTVHRLKPSITAEVLAGMSTDDVRRGHYAELPYRAHLGGGIVAVRRETWEAAPLDPRFAGWGQEDDSWGLALRALFGAPAQLDGRLWHLWHPPQRRKSRRRGSADNFALYLRYRAANGDPDAMRALLKEVSDVLPC